MSNHFTQTASSKCTLRRGSSYLEVQVAMVMLAIGMAGLYSMTVVQTRQSNLLRSRMPADDTVALNQAGSAWERKLGIYASIEEAVVPAQPIVPNASVEMVIDNLQPAPAFSFVQAPGDTHGWSDWTYTAAYLGNTHYHLSTGNSGSYAQFTASDLPPGDYEVLVTYPALAGIGTDVPHEVYDATAIRGSVLVNQTAFSSDFEYNGRFWDSLGVFEINSGTLTVRKRDGAVNGTYVFADAILIRSRRPLDVVSLAPTANGGATLVLEESP